jgi:acyl-CoA thioester hydrolase
MARIKLQLPAVFNFSTSLSVRITDVNYGGHLGNDAVLSLIHEARMRFLTDRGYTELDCGGAALIMSDVAIEFKAEAFYSDELQISVAATDFNRVGFDIYYLLKKRNGDGVIAVAKTGMICFDYSTKKVVSVPDGVKDRLLF